MPARILILNGPNLNLLGKREPAIYGTGTLADIERLCVNHGHRLGLEIDFRQSNHEGELVGWIHEALAEDCIGIIINAGAYTHTSVALHDALKAVGKPVMEVHLSNIHQREDFRHRSYISPVARGVICGCGADGYKFAIDALAPTGAQAEK